MPPINDPIRTLGLMAKFWDEGQAKTRLGASIGMGRAARVHRRLFRFLTRAMAQPSAVDSARSPGELAAFPPVEGGCGASFGPDGSSGWRLEVVASPAGRLLDFQDELRRQGDTWHVVPQSTGDLGHRMQAWFQARASHAAASAVLIGCDCPSVDVTTIETAFSQLAQAEVVLGPAVDGGYYLIGLRGPFTSSHEFLFQGIEWGTATVLSSTLAVCRREGWKVHLLPTERDIDTVEDLEWLFSEALSQESYGALSQLVKDLEGILRS